MTPLEQSLLHLPHIGGKRAAQLAADGCGCWRNLIAAERPCGISPARWAEIVAAARQSTAWLEADDPRPFAAQLPTREHWRVLHQWFEAASFFDIETSGLEPESEVTLVVCLHRGRLLRFLKDENLDDFLGLLDDVKLLVSFNGTGFDVPRIEDRFHVPTLPCAHVDLRWMCHHRGWRGGLKAIERQLGVWRPADLRGVGGAEAVWLWQQWSQHGHATARRTLERYCSADVITLQLLAAEVLAAHGCRATVPEAEALWEMLHAELPPPAEKFAPPPPAIIPPLAGPATGSARARAEKQARLRQLWRAQRLL